MRTLWLGVICLLTCSGLWGQQAAWLTDSKQAFDLARAQHKPMLIYFTGSDWCIWCKRLDSSQLDTMEFVKASQKWILLKADFPKYEQQSEKIRAQNELLAKIYGIEGLPTIVVISADGSAAGEIRYSKVPTSVFISKIESLTQF